MFSKPTLQILVLATVFVGLAGYNFINAWTSAPSNPPNSNASVPINVDSSYQAKQGDLGVVSIRAGWFCNADNSKCATLEELLADKTGDFSCKTDTIIVDACASIPRCPTGYSAVGNYWTDYNCTDSGEDMHHQSCVRTICPTPLVLGQHTEDQCTALGGTVTDDGSGNNFCRMTGAVCRVGWANYQHWSTRPRGSFDAGCPALTFSQSCSWPGNSWSNTPSPASQNVWCDGTSDNDNAQVSCSAPTTEVGCY
jgi:hypothetical protein